MLSLLLFLLLLLLVSNNKQSKNILLKNNNLSRKNYFSSSEEVVLILEEEIYVLFDDLCKQQGTSAGLKSPPPERRAKDAEPLRDMIGWDKEEKTKALGEEGNLRLRRRWCRPSTETSVASLARRRAELPNDPPKTKRSVAYFQGDMF